jgi:hypothetical protein
MLNHARLHVAKSNTGLEDSLRLDANIARDSRPSRRFHLLPQINTMPDAQLFSLTVSLARDKGQGKATDRPPSSAEPEARQRAAPKTLQSCPSRSLHELARNVA